MPPRYVRLSPHRRGENHSETKNSFLNIPTSVRLYGWLPLFVCFWLLLFSPMAFAEEGGIPYKVVFDGLDNDKLETLLRSVSLCERDRALLPKNRFILLRRTKKDEKHLANTLHSRGYFSAQVKTSIDFVANSAMEKPFRILDMISKRWGDSNQEITQVKFRIDRGPIYTFNRVNIKVVSKDKHSFIVPSVDSLSLVKGDEAVSQTIFTAEEKLQEDARMQGFAFAKIGKRRIQIDHDDQTMDVDLSLNLGKKVVLGDVTLTGMEGISQKHLLARIPWSSGTLYHPVLVEKARQSLLATGLFSIVRIRINPEPDEEKVHPVAIDMVQRKHRSISSGLGYGTGTSAQISSSWEHRNFLGAGEMVRIEGETSVQTTHLQTTFGKPDFLRMRQKLQTKARWDKEETEAFHRDALGVEVGLTRPLRTKLDFSYGLGYQLENVKDISFSSEESYGLFSTPVKLTWEERDDILDPSQGWYMTLSGSGILDTLGTGVWFFKFAGNYRHYYQLLDKPKLVLAGRLGLGSLLGSTHEETPANERFFVGGGGSLRGYGFQMANDVGADQKPLGGRSMVEFSTEARIQITESIGTVFFLDGGRAFNEISPTFDKDLFFGIGSGFRYQTPVGPLRLDVGFPMHIRPDVDDSYQVYISIGQAF